MSAASYGVREQTNEDSRRESKDMRKTDRRERIVSVCEYNDRSRRSWLWF